MQKFQPNVISFMIYGMFSLLSSHPLCFMLKYSSCMFETVSVLVVFLVNFFTAASFLCFRQDFNKFIGCMYVAVAAEGAV
jgi:hypothetical protein